jgi:hypothetical protein
MHSMMFFGSPQGYAKGRGRDRGRGRHGEQDRRPRMQHSNQSEKDDADEDAGEYEDAEAWGCMVICLSLARRVCSGPSLWLKQKLAYIAWRYTYCVYICIYTYMHLCVCTLTERRLFIVRLSALHLAIDCLSTYRSSINWQTSTPSIDLKIVFAVDPLEVPRSISIRFSSLPRDPDSPEPVRFSLNWACPLSCAGPYPLAWC